MAHTTSPSGFTYDGLLSFRGEDTRKNFISHLYTALVNARYRTFMYDSELERGENIKETLVNAIQQSQSSVIVFSEDYTFSRWCLDELVMILERKRTSDHAVLPVFYKVDPSAVRKQAKSFAGVLKYHENQSSEKLNEWRAALREVADLAGMVSENEADGHESKFIQKIVAVIQKKLPLVSLVPLIHVQKELKDKLLSVNPVLDDAEGKQLQFQTSVKPWLHKLKEVVYEAEDLLQEINTEVLRQMLEPESGSSTSHGQELISSPSSNAFDSAFIHPKVEEILFRLDYIMEGGRHVLGMEASAGYGVSQTMSSTSSLVEECLYGRDEEKETLVRLLVSDDESGDKIGVIPIVGMGGIGKTTLAQFLYNDVTVRQHFDLQAWVCVSKEFDVLRITQHIYESLTSKACQITNLALLQSKLQATVMGKRFFFVLDDIWNRNYNQLESLKRPLESGAHGSKIIVTTRNEDVASMMGTLSPQPDFLKPLSEEDGWLLFEKHAFTSRGVCGQSQLEEIGRQIVRKCNGLPLALKSLGGLIRSKLQSDEWDCEMWELPQEESDILPSLLLSYVHLPPHLKRCSMFPKNTLNLPNTSSYGHRLQRCHEPPHKSDKKKKKKKTSKKLKLNESEANKSLYICYIEHHPGFGLQLCWEDATDN
ncbi:hypothetical protein ACLB2K_005194 [Fragaria x ananassa]